MEEIESARVIYFSAAVRDASGDPDGIVHVLTPAAVIAHLS